MRLRVPRPVARNRETRAERILHQFPQAAGLVKSIDEHTGRYKFGISDKEIDQHYRFSHEENAKNFFVAHFAQFDDGHNDEHKVSKAVNNCVNLLPLGGEKSKPTENFRRYADHYIEEISNAVEAGVPYVSVIHGPTGSGKTAYSKCLFTAGVANFWTASIITSRIEFSKFFRAGEQIKAIDIVRAVHRCQVRDFLIWRFFQEEKCPSSDDILTFFPAGMSQDIRNKLNRFVNAAEGRFIGDGATTLLDAHRLWKLHVSFFDADTCSRILNEVKYNYSNLQFLVSLDGFDALKTKDFLVTENYHGPVSAVAEFLRNILNQFSDYVSTATSMKTHVMVYMRDTTYNRIELELHAGTSGPTRMPTRLRTY